MAAPAAKEASLDGMEQGGVGIEELPMEGVSVEVPVTKKTKKRAKPPLEGVVKEVVDQAFWKHDGLFLFGSSKCLPQEEKVSPFIQYRV